MLKTDTLLSGYSFIPS